MSNLRSTIQELAAQFASNVIGALRGASIDELTAVTQGAVAGVRRGRGRSAGMGLASTPAAAHVRRGKGGRLMRRSPDEIGKMVDSVQELLRKHPGGLRAEEIRAAIGCDPKELPRPLADGLKDGRLTKTGQKRATTYFAGSGAGGGTRRRGRAGAKKK